MTLQRGQQARRRSPRQTGQALVELALLGPLLIVLALGSMQVGSIAYTQVSLDTAAREGARAGVAAPNAALAWDAGGTVPASHQCTSADFTDGPSGNPACVATLNAIGFLSASTFTSNPCAAGQACVTLQVVGPTGLTAQRSTHRAQLMAASPCNNGNQATVNGTLVGVPSGMTATVTDTTGETQSGVTSTFTLCVTAKGSVTTQTLTAQAGPLSCGGYSGAVGPFSVQSGTTYSESITLVAEPACATPTPTPSAPPSATPTPTAGPTPTPTAGPDVSCAAQTVPDGDFITVTVQYPAPVFVPVLGNLFQTSSGQRLVSTSVTFAIEPCTLTDGG